MFRRIVAVTLGLCLFGQGCTLPARNVSTLPKQEEPQGQPSPEGFVLFHDGFGFLPGAPRTATRSPRRLTVLRARNPAPNETLLRNVTTAVGIPAGTLGKNVTGKNISVSWHDADGFTWDYNASLQTLTFQGPAIRNPARVVHTPLPTDAVEWAKAEATRFFDQHGIERNSWGREPIITKTDDVITITYAASQDVQPVALPSGAPERAGSMTLDPFSKEVISGWAVLPHAMDRSNYPALTSAEILERLRAGGSHPPTSDAIVTITEITSALYRDDVIVNGLPRTFYYPALWARGTSRTGDRITDYATVIPLVADHAFERPAPDTP
jgi:hypothetical protein